MDEEIEVCYSADGERVLLSLFDSYGHFFGELEIDKELVPELIVKLSHLGCTRQEAPVE